ncbi:hypothetical protein BH23CHL2_BH23CHL2_18150 [soil metagenome]
MDQITATSFVLVSVGESDPSRRKAFVQDDGGGAGAVSRGAPIVDMHSMSVTVEGLISDAM